MIWEVDEARIPSQFIKARRVAAIPDMARGHERVQHENRRRPPALRARKEIGTRDVVRWKLRIDRTLPCNGSAAPIGDYGRNFGAVGHGVIVFGGELLARRHIMLHFFTTPRVQMVTRLKQIDRRAHDQIDTARGKTTQPIPVGFTTKITKGDRGSLNWLFFVSFVVFVVDDRARFLVHSLFWWTRKIVRCERKFFA